MSLKKICQRIEDILEDTKENEEAKSGPCNSNSENPETVAIVASEDRSEEQDVED